MLNPNDDELAASFLPRNEPTFSGFIKIPDALRSQWNSQHRKFLITKIVLVIIAIILLIINSSTRLFHRINNTDCVQDYFQEWTAPINLYLQDNETPKNILIAVCSFLIDFNVLVMALRWIYYSQNLRAVCVILILYGARFFCQKMFYLEYPTGYIFDYPGFPSILVPYGPANDFFFSGHLGITTLCFLQFYYDKAKILWIIALITMPLEFFMLLVTRKHHFIDLPIGMLVAHYVFRLSFYFEDLVFRLIRHFRDEKRSEKGI